MAVPVVVIGAVIAVPAVWIGAGVVKVLQGIVRSAKDDATFLRETREMGIPHSGVITGATLGDVVETGQVELGEVFGAVGDLLN